MLKLEDEMEDRRVVTPSQLQQRAALARIPDVRQMRRAFLPQSVTQSRNLPFGLP